MFRHASKTFCYVYRLPRNHVRIYITPILRQQQRGTGSSRDLKPCPPVKSKKKYYYTLAILLGGAAGVIGYAKYDPDFREILTETVPGSNSVIKFVFEEEKSYSDNISDVYNSLKERINQMTGNIFGKADEVTNSKTEKSESEEKQEGKQAIAVKEDTQKTEGAPELKVETDIERAVKASAQDVIAALNSVKDAIRDQAESISNLVDASVQAKDSSVWAHIDDIVEEKQKDVDKAEKTLQAKKANFDKKRNQLPSNNSVKTTLDEVAGAMKDLEFEKGHLAAALKYAREVESSRDKINSELKSLLPSWKTAEQRSKLTLAEVDLFMLYAYNAITNFQQEIKKLDSVRDAKLREILERTKANVGDLDARIQQELQKEKAKFDEEFAKRKAEIEDNCENNLMEQFKRQTKVHHSVLEEALEDKEAEVKRRIQGQLLKQYEDEKKKYDTSLTSMVAKMKALNEAVQSRLKQEKKANQAPALWAACEELSKALKPGSASDSELQPLQKYIKVIMKAAVKEDEFVDSVLASIPRKAVCRGVFSEHMLRNRFEKVEKVAKRVAQVPEGGTSLPLILLAFLQSFFIVQANEPIPSYELANQPIDTASLNNFDILQRAKYWMERGDFEQALRYMNLLKGGARAVAKDWMDETTILLETQQAANVLKAYAIATGLIYL